MFAVAPKSLKGARAFSPWLPLADPRTDTYKQAYAKQNPGEKPDDLGIVGWGVGQIVAEGTRTTQGPTSGRTRSATRCSTSTSGPTSGRRSTSSAGVREGANVVAVLKAGRRPLGARARLHREVLSMPCSPGSSPACRSGAAYALVAVGVVLIYKCTRVLSLAQGEIGAFGFFIGLRWAARGIPGLGWHPARILTLVIAIVVGARARHDRRTGA